VPGWVPGDARLVTHLSGAVELTAAAGEHLGSRGWRDAPARSTVRLGGRCLASTTASAAADLVGNEGGESRDHVHRPANV
jgi:hypothetical protein